MGLIMESYSRFKLTEQIIDINGNETFGIMKKYDFLQRDKLDKDDIKKIFIEGTRVGRPDLIALDLYGSSIYYWVLMLFNNVVDPFGWPQNQTLIEAPSSSVVFTEIT